MATLLKKYFQGWYSLSKKFGFKFSCSSQFETHIEVFLAYFFVFCFKMFKELATNKTILLMKISPN